MASLGLNIIVFFFTYRWGISHRPLLGEKRTKRGAVQSYTMVSA